MLRAVAIRSRLVSERVEYQEFALFHENAAEYGIRFDGPPTVHREEVEVEPGLRISALKWGTGDPRIVFLHGGAQNAHTWDTVVLALGEPVVCLDLPGHGHSSWWPDHVYWPEPNAQKVAVAIEQLAPDAEMVIGMSLGGLTAIALAAQRPDLVRKLLIVDVTPGVNAAKGKAIADFVNGPQTFPSFKEIFERTVEHNPTRTAASLRRGILHNARQLDDGSWQWRYDRTFGGERRTDDFPSWNPLWDSVSSLTMPIVLTRGSVSPVVDDEDVAEFLRRQPTARYELFEGAGHSIQGDQPIELAASIKRFLES
jgi:pimeloyl-ACP methyl ester carboxylesterase